MEQVEQRNGILLPLKYTNLVGDGTKALDDLVKMGTIYAWNYISRGESVGFILTKDDVMPDVETSVYRAWRDRDFIEKEEAFKAANTIQLHNKTEIVSSFSRPEHGLDLDRLVLELNKRTEPGVFIWTGKSYSAAVVQALKDNGYIHGFKKRTDGQFF
ncbi:MAG: hypothetical protein HWD61_00725 [Parachlamydiaceae bacterium]|nr:MAG: hypothetical protein HWD61_00725 [Parachlamydiaceae bacterium]